MRHRVRFQVSPIIRRFLAVALAVGLLPVLSSAVQEQEPAQVHAKKIQELVHKAEDLQQAGELEQAAELRRRIRELSQVSAKRRESEERGEGNRDELREILKGLEQGMASLRALGKMEEVKRLETIAAGVRREMEVVVRERGDDERAVALRQLEIMRMAVKGLKEGEKLDAAGLLELAIRAREVALEGRRDEEAQAIRSRAPTPGAQAEMLGLAARLWHEFGKAERAELIAQLAKQLASREGRSGPTAFGVRHEARKRSLSLRDKSPLLLLGNVCLQSHPK